MSDSGKAVFLSYASQDAEAAKKICEALRAAGVEVWFDTDGGLEHGDEWDAKIRRQIKECVLFIPLVSANTQAREEGYFRLEWDLAAERARTIASGVAFILPVVVDDTTEPAALVPDRFRTVQWTKLPGGKVPAEVLQRFLKLWSHRIGALKPPGGSNLGASLDNARERAPGARLQTETGFEKWWWLIFPVFGMAMGSFWMFRPSGAASRALPETTAVAPSAPQSESRQLITKAWELMTRPEMAREELDAADDLCKRAADLDSNDAEVWAAWSQVDSWYVYHRLERTPARQDGARTKAARALNLSPSSYEARLAQACYLVREGGGQHAVYDLDDAESKLRALLSENPEEPRALLALGVLYRNTGKVAEYRDAFSRTSRTPRFAAQAYNELGWAEFFNGNFDEADVAVDVSIKLQPYYGNLGLKTYLFKYWWGDLEQAKATFDKFPAANRLEDYAVSTQVELNYWQRKPDAMLHMLDRSSRDWFESNAFDGPKAWWSGLAHHMAGREEAARLQWRTGLRVVERRLVDQPDSSFHLRWKARLLLASGNQAEGETALRLAREMGSRDYFSFEAIDEILLGHTDTAITILEQRVDKRERFLTATDLRLRPSFDPLRDLPRFQALLARMEADPRFSPNANQRTADGSQPSLPSGRPSAADPKSVAVLAFANLSDDKANEYFSDGISEELLNVLAKISGLKVTARTSSFHFKGKDTPIPEIAQYLGVAYVLEGSVRRSGDKVRITAQLIKAADGFHVWSDTFTRDLKDIFAVQDEIAGLIARAMQVKLGMTATPAATHEQATVPAAYDAYLQARSVRNKNWFTEKSHPDIVALLENAVALDPAFALGWADLSFAHVYVYFDNLDHTEARLAKAKAAIDTAYRLAPESIEVLSALGAYHYFGFRDYDRARELYERVARLQPNHAAVMAYLGELDWRQGRWAQALVNMERAAELDPMNGGMLINYRELLTMVRRFPEAIAIARRQVALSPDSEPDQIILAYTIFRATGSTEVGERTFARMPPDIFDSPRVVEMRKRWDFYAGNFAEFIRLDRQQPYYDESSLPRYQQALTAAIAYEANGDLAGARTRLAGFPEQIRARLETEPDNADLWQRLAQMEAILGNAAEAERCMNRAVALVPEGRDLIAGVDVARSRAFILARIGRKDEAIAEYIRFLAFPGGASVHALRHGAFWAILRGDPKWEAALNDPKNHAPLF